MSQDIKIIASAGIKGAYQILERAEKKIRETLDKYGGNHEVGFPNTGYYLPIIYGILGHKIEKLEDMLPVLDRCKSLLPAKVAAINHLPYLGPALDAGMVTLFAEEMEEAIRYIEEPDFYLQGEDVTDDNIWLGAADDVILRKRGVEFVDGTAPGFAAILGAAPDPETAAKIATELQEKNLYVFMAGSTNGVKFSEQLVEAGVQIGWPTRLVSFSPYTNGAVFAIGFATRAALSFGGIEPGDYRKVLIYNKDRVFAFALTMGFVDEQWYANGLGCVNYGFPIIADTPIPEILPTGVCSYEHVVSNIPHAEIVAKATEVRGLKVSITEVPVPVSYGPAFEGERVRGDDIYFEAGGGKTIGVELVTGAEMDDIEDGQIEVIGPELADMDTSKGAVRTPIAIEIMVAGREMQADFEPILERQIHHLINYAQGIMHIGQRDIAWVRVSKGSVDKGFKIEHLGSILHAKLHQDFGAILDKIAIRIYTNQEDAEKLLVKAREIYRERDIRVKGMTDEDTPTYYSCTLCQSFAPTHVCVVTPERTGLCGAYSWLDCKASYEINPTGPNQPIEKGRTVDDRLGQWEGANEFFEQASRGVVKEASAYSIMENPMTSCGCFEAIAAYLPMTNGIMIVDRDYKGETPSGMKFSTLAGTTGGGNVTPGFLGHSKSYISSQKFISAEGGIARIVWMPKRLKEEISEDFNELSEKLGYPGLIEKIADETVGLTEEDIQSFLQEKGHPALTMDPMV